MNPEEAFRIVSEAIPQEARGESLDEALGVLYDLAHPLDDTPFEV